MMASAVHPGRPNLLGVLYAEDFDDIADAGAAGAELAPEPETIEPVFTAAELEAARAGAFTAGRVEAEQGLAASRNHLLALLAAGFAEAQSGAREAAEAAAEGVARCILSALAACLPTLCQQHGAAELRALVRSLLPALSEEPRITIRVHPDMAAVVDGEVRRLDPEIGERIRVLLVDGMPPGDARITWADGSAFRDTMRSLVAFEEGLAELGLLQRERVDA